VKSFSKPFVIRKKGEGGRHSWFLVLAEGEGKKKNADSLISLIVREKGKEGWGKIIWADTSRKKK